MHPGFGWLVEEQSQDGQWFHFCALKPAVTEVVPEKGFCKTKKNCHSKVFFKNETWNVGGLKLPQRVKKRVYM